MKLFGGAFILFTILLGSFSATSEVRLRPFAKEVLSNGLTIYWISDTTLPLIEFKLMTSSGSAQDPKAREGLAAMTASLLSRGTKRRSATRLTNDFEQIASSLQTDVDEDSTLVSASALSLHLRTLLGLFKEAVFEPQFALAELEKLRQQSLARLQKLADSPNAFVGNLLQPIAYKDHPYGHSTVGLRKTLKSIRRADVLSFYKRTFTPEASVLTVIGQYTLEDQNHIRAEFERWARSKGTRTSLSAPQPIQGRQVTFVERQDLKQAQIAIVMRGIARATPEYMDLIIGLAILGDSFGSRLFDEIRERRGLVYSISANGDVRLVGGSVLIGTSTRVEKTTETLVETLKVLNSFVANGVTESEVATAKAIRLARFPQVLETAESFAVNLLRLHRFGIGLDYLRRFDENLGAVTQASVNAAIRKHLHPDGLRVLIYAPKEALTSAVKEIGPVEVKPYKDLL